MITSQRITRVVVATLVAVLALLIAPGAAKAQEGARLWISGLATMSTVRSAGGGVRDELSGVMLGGAGGVAWRRLSLHVEYLEGTLDGSAPTSEPGFGIPGLIELGPGQSTLVGDREYVEGAAFIGVAVLPGLELAGGAHARAATAPDDVTQRIVSWQLRARYEATVHAPFVRAYAEAWHALAGQTNPAATFDRGNGGAAGLLVHGGPLTVRLGYAIDAARFGDGARREVMDGVTLAVEYRLR